MASCDGLRAIKGSLLLSLWVLVSEIQESVGCHLYHYCHHYYQMHCDEDIVARHLFLGGWVHEHLPLILYLAFVLVHFKLRCPPDLCDPDS